MIQQNEIPEIRPSSFNSYPELINVNLSENQIFTIQDKTFEARVDNRFFWNFVTIKQNYDIGHTMQAEKVEL